MNDWRETKLGEILTLNYGWSLPKKKRIEGFYPVYGSNGVVGNHNKALVSQAGVIVGRKGSGGAIHFSNDSFCPIDTTFYTTQEDTPLDLKFLFYFLLFVDLKKLVTGVGVPGLNREVAYQETIVYPEKREEQRRIADILSTVQTAIEQQARLITLTRELKTALMHKLFSEGLRGESQKQTEIGLVSQSWDKVRLDQTGDVVYGIQAAVANIIKPIGPPILTNKNITLDGQIVLEEINYFELKTPRHFATLLQKGDILFNWRSGSKQHVGKTAYFQLDGEYTHSSFILRIRPFEKINNLFLYYYLKYLKSSGFFVKQHDFKINATFNKSAVNALPVYLPSKEEQKEIESIIQKVDHKLDFEMQKQELLRELFRTLLHELMTGKVRV